MGLYELLKRAKQGDEEAETDMIIAFLRTIEEIDLNKICMKNDGGITNSIWLFLNHKSVDLFRKDVSQSIETTNLNLDIIADDTSYSIDNKLFISMLLNSLPPLQ